MLKIKGSARSCYTCGKFKSVVDYNKHDSLDCSLCVTEALRLSKIYKEDKRLQKTYGITIADYDRMHEEQQGQCAICGRHQSVLSYRLYVDHDHETGKVRQLLCSSCNALVGIVETGKLTAVLVYIENHK